jgi:hypothetical protein
MTKTPTDRGIAFIKENANGTKNVYVAVGVAASAPEDVIAMHLDRQYVAVGTGVTTVAAGNMVRTTEAVHVSSGMDGVVQITARQRNLGPLLKQ